MAAGQGSCEVKSALQKFRYAATGRWAVSIRTYVVLVFPFGFLTSIEREQLLNGVGLTRAVTIALAGEVVVSLYLFIIQSVLLSSRKTELQPLLRCLFVWFSAGLVRGFFTAFYAVWAFGYETDLSVRIPPAAIYTTGAMALTAFYFGSIDRRRIQTQALNTLGDVLDQEHAQLGQLEADKRREVLSVFEAQLMPQVVALRLGIQKLLGGRIATEEVELRKLMAQSQEISQAINRQKEVFEGGGKAPSFQFNSEVQNSYLSHLIPQIISIRLTAIVMILGSTSGQFPRNGFKGVVAGVIGALFIVSILLPISILIKKRPEIRRFLMPLGFLGAFSVQYFFNLLQPTLGFDLNNPYAPWYSGLKSVYGVYVSSVIASLLVDTSRELEGANVQGATLRNALSTLNVRHDAIEKSLFETRFGTLQGKITGVTMALHLMGSQSMGQISADRKQELLESANNLLGESMQAIESLSVKTP